MLPKGLTTIGNYAFDGCYNLTSVVFLEGLTTIGKGAFHGCNGLRSLTMPCSLTEIGKGALYCSSLEWINLNGLNIPKDAFIRQYDNGDYSYLDEITAVINSSGDLSDYTGAKCVYISEKCTEITYIGSKVEQIYSPVSIPPTATESVFRCNPATTIVYIPKGSLRAYTHYDGWSKFQNLIELEEWPEIKYQDEYDIEVCAQNSIESQIPGFNIPVVKRLTVSGSLSDQDIRVIGQMQSLVSLDLTNTEIPDDSEIVYSNFPNLKKVSLPNSIVNLPANAFANCKNLKEIENLPQLTEIPEGCFSGCKSLKIEIPNTVQIIGDKAFQECNFDLLTIPQSVYKIGNEAFNNSKISRLIIEDSDETLNLGHGKFNSRNKAAQISGTDVDVSGIYYYTENWDPLFLCGMTSVYVGRNIDYIAYEQNEEYVQSERAKYITNIVYASPITIIEELRTVEIGANVTSLGPDETITFITGNTTSTYQPGNFYANLTMVTSNSIVPPTGCRFNEKTLENADLIVPNEAIEAYSSAPKWKDFKKVNIVYANSIKLNFSKTKIKVGEWIDFVATVEPANTANKDIIWASSNSDVLKIFEDGAAQGVSDGLSEVTATTTDGSNIVASCYVVVGDYIEVTSISLNENEITIEEGNSIELVATISPENAENKDVEWVSSDPSVASVSSSGVVDAKSVGEVEITVLAECGVKAICMVHVINKTGIEDTEMVAAQEVGRYDLTGKAVSEDYRGIVIVRYSDGTTSKTIQR